MKWISLVTVVGLTFSCATLSSKPLLRLQDRTLLIDPNGRGLLYVYNDYECKYPRRLIRRGCRWVRKEIIYDINEEKTRDKLNDALFECTSRSRFQY